MFCANRNVKLKQKPSLFIARKISNIMIAPQRVIIILKNHSSGLHVNWLVIQIWNSLLCLHCYHQKLQWMLNCGLNWKVIWKKLRIHLYQMMMMMICKFTIISHNRRRRKNQWQRSKIIQFQFNLNQIQLISYYYY